MVPALRPDLDQRALDGGGSTAEPDPPASDRLRPFSLRSTDRRQDGWSRARTEASPYRALRGAWIPLIVPCVHRSMGGVSPCAAARRRSRFVPAHGSRQTVASPLPLASVTPPACCRSCPSPATTALSSASRCRRYRHSQVSDNRSNLNL